MWIRIRDAYKHNPLASTWLLLMAFFVFFADIIATEIPLLVKEKPAGTNAIINANNYRNIYLQNHFAYDHLIFAPVPYSPGVTDADNLGLHSPFENNYFSSKEGIQQVLPLRFHHMLGTDARGGDVLAGVIHGARYSLSIAFLAMILSGFIALVTGILSGYFAGEGLLLNRLYLVSISFALFSGWFYGYYVQRFAITSAFASGLISGIVQLLISFCIFIIIIVLFHKTATALILRFPDKKYLSIPVDAVVTRITELFTAVPKVILVISLVAISQPSVFTLVIVFGIIEWTDLSRMIRAEVMRLRQSGFVEAAKATGLSSRQIIIRHILPNVFPMMVPVLIYGISIVILTESGLAFLGLGVAPGTVTWGNLIAQGKENIEAWWLMLFPGLMILFTVLSLNSVIKK